MKEQMKKWMRKQLATFIVAKQVERGVIARDRQAVVVNGWLNGCGAARPTKKADLYRYAIANL